jgi:uncharacterized protein (UPF0548 family)
MKFSIHLPSSAKREAFIRSKTFCFPTYPEIRDTTVDFTLRKASAAARKYDYDENRILLGTGRLTFEAAKAAIREWQMFPTGWIKVHPHLQSIEAGNKVAVFFKVLGLWWWNSSEIIYTIDEEDRFGFAYGTLSGHVETGEERFLVEMDKKGRVWYSIKAFSRPSYQIVRLVYPFARSRQKKFVRDSMQQMKRWVEEYQPSGPVNKASIQP